MGIFRSLCRRIPAQQERHHDIFESCELRQKMVELENETHGLVAKARQFLKAQCGDFGALNDDRSSIRPIHAAQDVQQGALAGSRNPGDGHHLAFRQAETQIHQHLKAFVS